MMPYDPGLAERIREYLADFPFCHEREMFGGCVFFINGNMCCGVIGDALMARVGPCHYRRALASPHARPMDFTGRPLTGFVYVAPAGLAARAQLAAWIDRAIAFAGALPPK